MKSIFAISALMVFSAVPAFAQTQPVSTASDDNVTRTDGGPRHNYGWVGLIGLVGFSGTTSPKE